MKALLLTDMVPMPSPLARKLFVPPTYRCYPRLSPTSIQVEMHMLRIELFRKAVLFMGYESRGAGSSFALLVVLFILLIIIGASYLY